MSQTMPVFLVHASKLAAAVGMNRYHSPWETFHMCWKNYRFDGNNYARAWSRYQQNHPQHSESDQSTSVLAKDLALTKTLENPEIQECMRATRAQIETRASCLSEISAQLTQSVEAIVDRHQASASTYETVPKAPAIVPTDSKLCDNVSSSSSQPLTVTSTSIPAAPTPTAIQLSPLSSLPPAQVQSPTPVQSSAAATALLPVRILSKQEIMQAVKTQAQLYQGIVGEQKAVEELGIIRNNEDSRKGVLGVVELQELLTIPYGVIGRIDGFKDGQLVEIKKRTSCIRNYVPDYEQPQLLAYMHLYNEKKIVCIQEFDNETRKIKERRESVFPWSDSLWEEICRKLAAFARKMAVFITIPDLQDQWMLADEKGRRELFSALDKNEFHVEESASKRLKVF